MIAISIYLLAALYTGLIAYHIPVDLGRPRDNPVRLFGSVLMGILWPLTLPFHLKDIR